MTIRLGRIILVSLLVSAGLAGCGKPQDDTGRRETTIQIKGSDTMVNLGQAWAEAYMKKNRQANIAVTGGGSGTGIAAMMQGTTDIAETSRAMSDQEISEAKARGITPVQHEVALDALVVIVNRSNPVSRATIRQLSDIFSGKITNWKQIGGRNEEIVLMSRDRNSGSHMFFLERVVRLGNAISREEYAAGALMMLSSEAIAAQVATDEGAIGYVGLGYADPEKHKTLMVAETSAGPFVCASIATVIEGIYPISRPLYWYTRGEPRGQIKSLLDFVLSAEGQRIVSELGFAPIRRV